MDNQGVQRSPAHKQVWQAVQEPPPPPPPPPTTPSFPCTLAVLPGSTTGVCTTISNNINSSPVHQQSWQAEILRSTTPTTSAHLYTNRHDRQKYRVNNTNTPPHLYTNSLDGQSTAVNNPSSPVHQQSWWTEVPQSTPPTTLLTCTPTVLMGRSTTVNNININNPSSPVHQQSWWAEVQQLTPPPPTTPPHLYTNHQQHHQLLTCTPAFSTGFSNTNISNTNNPSSPVHQQSWWA